MLHTLHRHLMHFCSPWEAIIGCHSSPFLCQPIGDLHVPGSAIELGILEGSSSWFSGSPEFFITFGLTCRWENKYFEEINFELRTYVGASLATSFFIRTICNFFTASQRRALNAWAWNFQTVCIARAHSTGVVSVGREVRVPRGSLIIK